MSAPAIAGAGGYAMLACPMKWTVNWQAPLKPMNSITLRARRDKRTWEKRSPWDAARVVAARSASWGGAITIKTGQRLSRGAVARGQSSYKRLAYLPG